MFILKKEHQPGVYVPLRALFLVTNCNQHILGCPKIKTLYNTALYNTWIIIKSIFF